MKDKDREELIAKKREELLKKYSAGKFDLDKYKHYSVFRRPIDSIRFDEMELIATCDSELEAIEEIRWRCECTATGFKDTAVKKDKRFDTFHDDSETGKKMEDYMQESMDYSGQYLIIPVFNIQ
jgi:hypothetical protein